MNCVQSLDKYSTLINPVLAEILFCLTETVWWVCDYVLNNRNANTDKVGDEESMISNRFDDMIYSLMQFG